MFHVRIFIDIHLKDNVKTSLKSVSNNVSCKCTEYKAYYDRENILTCNICIQLVQLIS